MLCVRQARHRATHSSVPSCGSPLNAARGVSAPFPRAVCPFPGAVGAVPRCPRRLRARSPHAAPSRPAGAGAGAAWREAPGEARELLRRVSGGGARRVTRARGGAGGRALREGGRQGRRAGGRADVCLSLPGRHGSRGRQRVAGGGALGATEAVAGEDGEAAARGAAVRGGGAAAARAGR